MKKAMGEATTMGEVAMMVIEGDEGGSEERGKKAMGEAATMIIGDARMKEKEVTLSDLR